MKKENEKLKCVMYAAYVEITAQMDRYFPNGIGPEQLLRYLRDPDSIPDQNIYSRYKSKVEDTKEAIKTQS